MVYQDIGSETQMTQESSALKARGFETASSFPSSTWHLLVMAPVRPLRRA